MSCRGGGTVALVIAAVVVISGRRAQASPSERPLIEAALAEADAVVIASVVDVIGGVPTWRFRVKVERVVKPESLEVEFLDAAVFGGAQSGGYPSDSGRVVLFLSRPEREGAPWDSDLAIDLEALEKRFPGIGERWMRGLPALHSVRAATGAKDVARAWANLLFCPGFERTGIDRLVLGGAYATAPKTLRDEIARDRKACANALAALLVARVKDASVRQRGVAFEALRALRSELRDMSVLRDVVEAARKAAAMRDDGAIQAVLLLAEAGDGSWQKLFRAALIAGQGKFLKRLLDEATRLALLESASFKPILDDSAVGNKMTELLTTRPVDDEVFRFLEAAVDGADTRPTSASREELRAKWKRYFEAAGR